jgi:hypothetical protein
MKNLQKVAKISSFSTGSKWMSKRHFDNFAAESMPTLAKYSEIRHFTVIQRLWTCKIDVNFIMYIRET